MTFKAAYSKQRLTRLMPWLIALFVVAQLVATAHAASFGDGKHMHDGHPCIISTACKHASDMDLAKPALVVEVPEWHEFQEKSFGLAAETAPQRAETIRGPPAHH